MTTTATAFVLEHPDQRPTAHDFPYLTCCVCRFPIPPTDLVGGDYDPRHASTCPPLIPGITSTAPAPTALPVLATAKEVSR